MGRNPNEGEILNCGQCKDDAEIPDILGGNGACLPPSYSNRLDVYDAVIETDPITGRKICKSTNCPDCKRI